MTDKKTPIDPITRDDERVNIPRPELAATMDPDDAKLDHIADRVRAISLIKGELGASSSSPNGSKHRKLGPH
jgi:hypothetical protein